MGHHTVAELTRPTGGAIKSQIKSFGALARRRNQQDFRQASPRFGNIQGHFKSACKIKAEKKKRQPTDSQRDGIRFGHDSKVVTDAGSTAAAWPQIWPLFPTGRFCPVYRGDPPRINLPRLGLGRESPPPPVPSASELLRRAAFSAGSTLF